MILSTINHPLSTIICQMQRHDPLEFGNGRKAKIVPITAAETLNEKNKRTIVCAVDVFGNDVGLSIEVGK